jgi:hypothetical protein
MAGPEVVRDMGDTLVTILQAGIPPALVPAARIMVATPDEFSGLEDPPQPTVTVFLYRTTVVPSVRNAPKRLRADGRVMRQALPLELSYLITPWARQTRDELLIAGRILQVLHDRAELGATDLVGASWEPTDTVQICFESLPLEDHYRIWDANTVSYRLSLTYTARVIHIAATDPIGGPPVISADFEMTLT